VSEDLLTDVVAAIQRKQSDRAERFAALVRRIADGEALDAWQAADELADLGRNAAQLEQAVAYLKKRRELRARADCIPSLERELAEARAQSEAEVAAWQEQEKSYQARIVPLFDRVNLAQHQVANAYRALAELERSYRGSLTAESAAVAEQKRKLTAEVIPELRSARARVNWELTGPHRMCLPLKPSERELFKSRGAEIDRQIEEVEAQIRECDEALRNIQRAMLTP
jgi:chromosome segregation ATPase